MGQRTPAINTNPASLNNTAAHITRLCMPNTSAVIYCKAIRHPTRTMARCEVEDCRGVLYLSLGPARSTWCNGVQTTAAARSALTNEIDLLQMERKGWTCLARVNGR